MVGRPPSLHRAWTAGYQPSGQNHYQGTRLHSGPFLHVSKVYAWQSTARKDHQSQIYPARQHKEFHAQSKTKKHGVGTVLTWISKPSPFSANCLRSSLAGSPSLKAKTSYQYMTGTNGRGRGGSIVCGWCEHCEQHKPPFPKTKSFLLLCRAVYPVNSLRN